MENALQVTEQDIPKEITKHEIEDAPRVASIFKGVMAQKARKIMFGGKEYAEFPDWQVISSYYGITPRTHTAEPIEIHGVKGFKAQADLVNEHGIVVGGAEAFCMMDEPNWARKPLFQLASMAQTRAACKAISNRYRWVVAMAGYGTTPAEEIQDEKPRYQQEVLPARSTPKGEPFDCVISSISEKVSKKGNKYWAGETSEGVKFFTYSQKVAAACIGSKMDNTQITVYAIYDGKSHQLVEA